jgi:hypothetical protein
VKNLFKTIIIKVLINGVYNYLSWERLYTLPNMTLLNVKQVMKNHIQVEEENATK